VHRSGVIHEAWDITELPGKHVAKALVFLVSGAVQSLGVGIAEEIGRR
jgi:hypothetical protein